MEGTQRLEAALFRDLRNGDLFISQHFQRVMTAHGIDEIAEIQVNVTVKHLGDVIFVIAETRRQIIQRDFLTIMLLQVLEK
jgi:hypothetical protein